MTTLPVLVTILGLCGLVALLITRLVFCFRTQWRLKAELKIANNKLATLYAKLRKRL